MKFKKILLCCLFSIISVIGLCACETGDDMDKNLNLKVIVNDFSDYKTCFMPIRLGGYFGSVEVNTDTNYVLSGDQSAKLTVYGDPDKETTARPNMLVPLKIDGGYNYSDFSSVDKVESNVYNASDRDINMYVSLSYGENETEQTKITLKKGEWTKAIVNADIERYGIGNDITDARNIKFYFDILAEGESVPVLYMDDIALHKFASPPQIASVILDENEVCSFDKLYQEYIPISKRLVSGYDPVLSINTNPQFAQNGYSLKCEYKGNDNTFNTWTYTGFAFPAQFVQQTPIVNMEADDYFAFDVYNDSNDTQRIMINFRQSDDFSVYFSDTVIYLPPKKWTTLRYSGEQLNANSALTAGTKKAGEIYIHWDIYLTAEGNRTMYLDSFRIEKGH